MHLQSVKSGPGHCAWFLADERSYHIDKIDLITRFDFIHLKIFVYADSLLANQKKGKKLDLNYDK